MLRFIEYLNSLQIFPVKCGWSMDTMIRELTHYVRLRVRLSLALWKLIPLLPVLLWRWCYVSKYNRLSDNKFRVITTSNFLLFSIITATKFISNEHFTYFTEAISWFLKWFSCKVWKEEASYKLLILRSYSLETLLGSWHLARRGHYQCLTLFRGGGKNTFAPLFHQITVGR